MAESHDTLGTRFPGSKFLANTYISHSTEHFLPNHGASCSSFFIYYQLDAYFAELMETLRLQLNDVLRLPFSVQKRSRLLRNYWEVELLVKEMRLLLNPDELFRLRLSQLQQKSKSP